jgi:hypothetical protein
MALTTFEWFIESQVGALKGIMATDGDDWDFISIDARMLSRLCLVSKGVKALVCNAKFRKVRALLLIALLLIALMIALLLIVGRGRSSWCHGLPV